MGADFFKLTRLKIIIADQNKEIESLRASNKELAEALEGLAKAVYANAFGGEGELVSSALHEAAAALSKHTDQRGK